MLKTMKKVKIFFFLSLALLIASCSKKTSTTSTTSIDDIFYDYSNHTYHQFNLSLLDKDFQTKTLLYNVSADTSHLNLTYLVTNNSSDTYIYNYEAGIAIYTTTSIIFNDDNYYILVDENNNLSLIVSLDELPLNNYVVAIDKEYDEGATSLIDILNLQDASPNLSQFSMTKTEEKLTLTNKSSEEQTSYDYSLNKPNKKISISSQTISSTRDYIYDNDSFATFVENIYFLVNNLASLFTSVSNKETIVKEKSTIINFTANYYALIKEMFVNSNIDEYKTTLNNVTTQILITGNKISKIRFDISSLYADLLNQHKKESSNEALYLQLTDFTYNSSTNVQYRKFESAQILWITEIDYNRILTISRNKIINRIIN